jgi:hypothetical protein
MMAGITERIVMNFEEKAYVFMCFCIIWLLVLLTMKITHHPPVPKKKLIFLERNKASFLVDETDWKEIMDNAEEVT